MDAKLAIVIPAYKIEFFEYCLESIANQTDKGFRLYIGIDGSPFDFESVVNKYSGRISIHCCRFEDNLGATDLVGHWERCIEMVRDEEWIWLFSDDDYMDNNCVENFYATLNAKPGFDLYHFDIRQVDRDNRIVRNGTSFPEVLGAEDFMFERLNHKLMSLVVEYIFSREKFIKVGGFQRFDLAWGSDDSTWIKIALDKGICNISNAKVYWRRSDLNISTNKDYEILLRKYQARIEQAKWLLKYMQENGRGYDLKLLKKALLKWFEKFIYYEIEFIKFADARLYALKFLDSTGQPRPYSLKIISALFILRSKHLIKSCLKRWIGKK